VDKHDEGAPVKSALAAARPLRIAARRVIGTIGSSDLLDFSGALSSGVA
jgi:hypothetical protein